VKVELVDKNFVAAILAHQAARLFQIYAGADPLNMAGISNDGY